MGQLKKRTKFFSILLIVFFYGAMAFSLPSESGNKTQKTAVQVMESAVAKKSPVEAISYIKAEILNISVPAQKRALLSFLASLQESVSFYDDARSSYAAAAAIAAGDVAGMPKKSSQQLVLDAVRCALCAGQSETASSYLNSAVRNSKDEKIQAQIKLFEQWAALCMAESENDISEPVSMLQAYENLPSMNSVRPSVLLTLWYLTGKAKYSVSLKKDYPYSAECGIVSGKVQVLPAPFWYFVPRQAIAEAENPVLVELKESSEKHNNSDSEKKDAETVASNEKSAQKYLSKNDGEVLKSEKTVFYQLGLFREKANAEEYMKKVVSKGFSASIQNETRASGTTYYLVVVPENNSKNVAQALRSAGFECYPIFD